VLLEHSGETSFSKWKRRFHFEEEEQRNERALTHWVEASDMQLATTNSPLCERYFGPEVNSGPK
jgi:hypothetical protein